MLFCQNRNMLVDERCEFIDILIFEQINVLKRFSKETLKI